VFGWLPPNANYSLVVWILPTATHNQTRPIAQIGLGIWHQDIVHITGGHLVDVKLLRHQWQPVASDVEVGCLWQLCAEGPHAFCCMSYLSCLFKHSPSGILMFNTDYWSPRSLLLPFKGCSSLVLFAPSETSRPLSEYNTILRAQLQAHTV